jgi:hypothetical protein
MDVNVLPTRPLMVDPGPVLVQVTVPTVGAAFVPRTAYGADAPNDGETATCAAAVPAKAIARNVEKRMEEVRLRPMAATLRVWEPNICSK